MDFKNFDTLRFYCGTREEYDTLAEKTLLDNHLYFVYDNKEETDGERTVDESEWSIYLKDKVITSSNIESSLETFFLKMKNNFIYANPEDEVLTNNESNQTESQTIQKGLKVESNISAKNYLHIKNGDNEYVKIPMSIETGEITVTKENDNNTTQITNKSIMTQTIQVDSFYASVLENEEIVKKQLFEGDKIKNLKFAEGAKIEGTIPIMESTDQDEAGNAKYSLDLENGTLKVSQINVDELIYNNSTAMANNQIAKFNTLQIGNILLSEDNGNLKITSVIQQQTPDSSDSES